MLDIVDEITADAASRTPEQFRRRLNERAREISDDDGVARSEQQRDEARLHIDLGTLHSRSLPDLLADTSSNTNAHLAA